MARELRVVGFPEDLDLVIRKKATEDRRTIKETVIHALRQAFAEELKQTPKRRK